MMQFARTEWDRARKSLASAEQLAQGDPDSAASRAYYAAFHALTAFFALRGQMFSKHTELRAALHRDLIRTGLFPSQLGRDFDFLLALRDTGDYGGLAHVPQDSVQLAVRKAGDFITAIASAEPALNE